MAIRDIIFRGKRLDNGEWVEGCLAAYDLIAPDYPEDTLNATGEYYGQTPYVGFIAVDPDTIGQFTGLCDKNGKKIFEGDIIEADNGHISAIVKVEYGSYRPDMFFDLYRNAFGYVPSQNLYGYYLESKNEQMLVVDSPYMEVIGNKWDNPELLEGEG